MFTKIVWFTLIGSIFAATIAMIFVFPYAWSMWTFGGLAIFELIIFYLLDTLRKTGSTDSEVEKTR